MFCFSVSSRNLNNLFKENKICSICFKLQEIVIGYDKHFIVWEENYTNLVHFSVIEDFLYIESLDFEVIGLVSEMGPVIIIGNNLINCQGMLPMIWEKQELFEFTYRQISYII